MKRFRWQAVLAGTCSLLALTALTFWMPSAADVARQKEDLALRQMAKGAKANLAPVKSTPPAPTNEAIVYLKAGSSAAQVALAHGLTVKNHFKSDPNIVVLAAPDLQRAAAAQPGLAADARVKAVYPNYRSRHVRFWNSTDQYFAPHNNNGFRWPGKWELDNLADADGLLTPFTNGVDVNVQPAWTRGVTGFYVNIGIVDDGMETTHPDLVGTYLPADSWDFGSASPDGQAGQDSNPNPVYASDNHGTAVTGVAAARGSNPAVLNGPVGVGVTGSAPHAFNAMLRVDFNAGLISEFADAVLFHSSGANTNLKVKNHSYGITDNFIETNSEETNLVTSASAGTIHCWAAGNSRGNLDQDANKADLQNNPNALTIAAVGSDGTFASYSNFGANIIASTPSNTSGGFGIHTTDRTGAAGYNGGEQHIDRNYTVSFGGTSSASPTAAGIMALLKQVSPNANARFAKHLLVRTSAMVDPNDSSLSGGGDGSTPGSAWITNAAGNEFNQNYGFGVINADALTLAATQFNGVTPLQTEAEATTTVNTAIPDDDPDGVSRTFSIAATTPLEEVEITLNVTHTYRGDLEAYLISPSGTEGRLFSVAGADSDPNLNWTFTGNQWWGENPAGTWTLIVRDSAPADTGTWNSFSANMRMGRLGQITVSSTSVPAGNPVTATWYAPQGASATDWVGLYNTAADNRTYLAYVYTGGAATGTWTVNMPNTTGTWEFRYLLNNGYTSVTESPTVTTTTATYTVDVTPEPATAGGTINVAWTAPVGRPPTDWLGLFQQGASNQQWIRYIYTGGATSGNQNIPAPGTPGNYEVRYLPNNGYTDVKATDAFVVN